MIILNNITKVYKTGDSELHALKGINLAFRENEFVSVLGQSGCGKTTLLNITGGLDRYTDGDLVIDGVSTKNYKDKNWDTYRNNKVGFVFQSYNLIAHLSILANVEIALTLSGISKKERLQRAKEALIEVGLEKHLKKKPNQLSGGQMQRVAIARALINNPSIILADEPTGALDSETSVQIMQILKKVSKNRLVVMVTHNAELAEEYSTRIIKMKDGLVEEDTKPVLEKELKKLQNKEQKVLKQQEVEKKTKKSRKQKQSAMSYLTSLALSGKNLLSKKAKTFMTAFAGSIGIIGIALVLAISNGFNLYITKMQTDILAGYPISVSTTTIDMQSMMKPQANKELPKDFNNNPFITVNEGKGVMDIPLHFNFLTERYVDYVQKYIDTHSNYNEFSFSYESDLNVVAYNGEEYKKVKYPDSSSSAESFMMGSSSVFYEGIKNTEFLEKQYDVLKGSFPKNANEAMLVIPANNYIEQKTLEKLQIEIEKDENGNAVVNFDSVVGKEYKVVTNNNFYTYNETEDSFAENKNYQEMFEDKSNIAVTISGVVRVDQEASIPIFNTGVVYTKELTTLIREQNLKSEIVKKQQANKTKLYTPYLNADTVAGAQIAMAALIGTMPTTQDVINHALANYGASPIPSGFDVYPIEFNAKQDIVNYLNAWNDEANGNIHKILLSDPSSMLTGTMSQMVDIISYVLIAFASVSLFVSSIMIGVLTYASVIERKKEIGVLRSIGARKKDISRVFNSETFIIGTSAGCLGVLVTYLVSPIINAIVHEAAGSAFTGNIAVLNPIAAIALITISCALTLVAGLIPAKIAAKNDPVKALRAE